VLSVFVCGPRNRSNPISEDWGLQTPKFSKVKFTYWSSQKAKPTHEAVSRFDWELHIHVPEYDSSFYHGHQEHTWWHAFQPLFKTTTVILPVVCMGMKLGLPHSGLNVGWGFLRIGYWGEYLGLSGTRWQWSGEIYIMRILMICNAHPLLFGWSNREEWDERGM